jgi:hypothetical protein
MSEVTNYPENSPQQPVPWDPFQLMDRLDEEALRKELDGIAGTVLVYVVREGGQEIVGLSKTGVDECCMALVSQGQAIREEDLQYEVLGDGEDREALFTVKAARFAISPTGQEVRLDQVIGVKRQPLYTRAHQLNPHWFEQGAMKAARNARFRLIPGLVRAQVIGRARQSGHTRVIDAPAAQSNALAPQPATPTSAHTEVASRAGPYAPTEKQVAFYQRLADSPVFTDEERRRALDWLASKATRQTIKDQIDWLKRQVETRRTPRTGESAA